jgi:hypothetical protein
MRPLPTIVTLLFLGLLFLGLTGCAYGDKSMVVIWGHPPMLAK